MKRILSLGLALIIVISSFIPAFGAASNQELYNQAGEVLKKFGVLQGSDKYGLMLDQKLKRQDMVVLISRLYQEEDAAKNYSGKNNFSDVRSNFYKPYISWAVDKGLIIGTSPGKFGYDNPVTVQQFQTLLLRALGYGEEAKNYDNVPKTAESLGLMVGLNATPKQDVQRGLMAAMTLNALRLYKKGSSLTLAQELRLDIPDSFSVDANATIDRRILKFEGIAKGTETLKVHLKPISSDINASEKYYDIDLKSDGRFTIQIDNLQSGKYEYKFLSGNFSTQAKTITIPELPFELVDVKAHNLKEISLNFTGPVDKNTSLFADNYFTNAGSVKSVRLENNDTTIILTINETMKNQNTYKITANKIISSTGKDISIKDKEFDVFDNQPPKVDKIIQLGNKGLRVYMSEPVKLAKSTNFKIDGKSISAQVQTEDNVITIKYISSYYAPTEGRHILNVSGLEDYAGYRAVDENITFDIVKDTVAPKIINASATLEEAIIQFDEEIDPTGLVRTNFYWKSGSTKRYPNSVQVLNDKVILNYSGSILPNYEISLFAENVADYSGNKLKSEEVKVKPVIDMTNPEVVNLVVSPDGKSITVYFSKNVDGRNRAYYNIKDKDNRTVYIRSIEGSGRIYTINLNTALPIGTNTITIEGVVDTTTLKNRLITYSQQIYMDDVEEPEIISYSAKDNKITLMFSKEMDLSTVENRENYLMDFGGVYNYLPIGTEFNPVYDGKTYIIILPEEIDGKKVNIGSTGNIKKIDVSRLKAANGISIAPTTLTFDNSNQGQAIVKKAELIEPNTIKVIFDQPIVYASTDDFAVAGRTVAGIDFDGTNEVVIYLNDRNETTINGNLTIKDKNSIQTFLGIGAKAESIIIGDKIPPRISSESRKLTLSGRTIYLPFTEKLEPKMLELFKRDLIIDVLGKEILDDSDYSISLDTTGTILRISVNSSVAAPNGYSVRLVKEPKYIMDMSGNIVEFDGYDYYAE